MTAIKQKQITPLIFAIVLISCDLNDKVAPASPTPSAEKIGIIKAATVDISSEGEIKHSSAVEPVQPQNVSEDQLAQTPDVDSDVTHSSNNSDEKLGEIVSRESSKIIGDYYIVKLKLSGYSPINVKIKANTSEEALAKIVKKDDFLLVRRDSCLEEVYVARFGKIINVYSSFTVPESSPVGVSYQNGRLGSEEDSISFEGYSGLNGKVVTIAAKRFFQLRDNSLIADTDYIWNFALNRELHDKGLKTFEAAIVELGSAKKEFNPDDPAQWNQIMIPATQALLVAAMSGKEAEIKSIYTKLAEKFGNDPVDFLKGELDSLMLRFSNSQKIATLAEAQREQEQSLLKEQNTVKSPKNSQLVESSQASIIGLWDCGGEDKQFTFDNSGRVSFDSTSTGQHMYLHGSYVQNNAVIQITYNSIEAHSVNVPLTSGQQQTAQVLSSDRIAVFVTDPNTGVNYPPYYCNKTSMSTSNIRSSAPIINLEGDAMERYANSLASQLENSPHPACSAIASSIRSFGSSGAPDYVRQRQIDAIFDKTPGICLQ